jgi:hypothetical protein
MAIGPCRSDLACVLPAYFREDGQLHADRNFQVSAEDRSRNEPVTTLISRRPFDSRSILMH